MTDIEQYVSKLMNEADNQIAGFSRLYRSNPTKNNSYWVVGGDVWETIRDCCRISGVFDGQIKSDSILGIPIRTVVHSPDAPLLKLGADFNQQQPSSKISTQGWDRMYREYELAILTGLVSSHADVFMSQDSAGVMVISNNARAKALIIMENIHGSRP